MSMYFAKGVAASIESKHHKKNANGVSKHEQAWSTMPNGFPAFPQSTFPNDRPPTLFHPASPKLKATKTVRDVDAESTMSASTFASTVSLLKENVKAKFPSKDKKARKGAAETLVSTEEKTSSPMQPSARAQTADAYKVVATMKH